MRPWRDALGAVAISLLFAGTSHGEPLAVRVINASKPTQCAETDNVYLKLTSRATRRFTIEARHPGYITDIVKDSMDPDFGRCDMSRDPSFKFEPRKVTLYQDQDWMLVGYTFPTNWRPTKVPVRVGDRTEDGLHLVQVWKRVGADFYEALVVYPSDGYWRARPLAPPNLKEAGYGSSFLIGPIEFGGRPLVAFREIAFDPAARTIRVAFARGGTATLRIDALTSERQTLDVRFDRAIAGSFAALRSMFVSETNADVAQIAWHRKGTTPQPKMPIMDFKRARAAEVWTGRTTPSLHNMSAPDTVFKDFATR